MLEKAKSILRSFMYGRYGIDRLSTVLLWAAVIFYVLAIFTGFGLFTLLSLAGGALALYRVLSRNVQRRGEENKRYLDFEQSLRKEFRQARARFTNRKIYKYFRCPRCRVSGRCKRHTGEHDVTCRHCQARFTVKT